MTSLYLCEWPGCVGQLAVYYVDQGETHRPVCVDHCAQAEASGGRCSSIETVDPLKVPHKPPTQRDRNPPEASNQAYSPLGPGPMPSRPPLREAFANLATALLETAKLEVERWRK